MQCYNSRFYSLIVLAWISIPGNIAVASEAGSAGYSGDSYIPDQVWKVRLEGNETYSDMVLKEQIATEAPSFLEKLKFWDRSGHTLNEIEIQKDVIRIRNFYQRRGFIQVQVDYRIEEGNKEWKKKVVFLIDENAAVYIERVHYTFEAGEKYETYVRQKPSFQRLKRRQPFQPGERYESISEPEVIGQVTGYLKNLGFAFAGVTISAEIDTSKLAAYLTIFCDTGPLTKISTISVEGGDTMSDTYVIKESGLKKGERYSLDKIQEAQQELFNHHLFRFATINIPQQEQDTTLNLLLRVRENPLRSVQASIGFGTEEYIRGQVSWTHRNAFQLGHKFTAIGHASFIEQTAGLDYLLPYVFNPKSSIIISPFVQHLLETNYELFRGGITNSFIYQYRRNATGSISYQFTKNLELSQQLDADLPDTTLAYDLSSWQFNGYYSEGFSRIQRGWVIQTYAELSGLLGLATYGFQKFSFDVRRYTKLTDSATLATRVQAGGLFDVRSDSLPANIRFYLGGTNSVRGWYRHSMGPKRAIVNNSGFVRYIPVGGRAMFGFNVEIRQDLHFLIEGLGIAAFLDGGQVWRNVQSVGNRPVQFGTGGGLRYRSPIGPVRIDIGYKLNPTPEDLDIYAGQNYGSAWDRIGIHFSIGQAF